MRRHGVVLSTWRHGWDVMDRCTELVEKALKEVEKENGSGGNSGGGHAKNKSSLNGREK